MDLFSPRRNFRKRVLIAAAAFGSVGLSTSALAQASISITATVNLPAGKTEGDLIARDTLTYHVEVENTGNVNLDNVTYDTSDFNPGTSLSFNMPSSPDSGDTGGDGILGVGETWIYDVEYDLWQQDILAGAVVNQIDVSADDPVNNPVTDASATLTTTLTQLPIDVVARPGVCGMVNYSAWEVVPLMNDGQIIYDGTDTTIVNNLHPRDAYNALALSDDGSRVTSRFGAPDLTGSNPMNPDWNVNLTTTGVSNPSHTSEYLLAILRVEGESGSNESFEIFPPSGSSQENTYYWIEDEAGIVLDTGGTWLRTWANSDGNQIAINFTYPTDGVAYVYIARLDAVQGSSSFNVHNYAGCPNPAFTITKDVDSTNISAPETLDYTITVENTGDISLSTPVLTVTLMQDSNALTLTSGPTLDSGDTDGDGKIDTTETWVYSASYAATQANIDDGNDIINTASLDTDQLAPASDDATTAITTTSSLAITATVNLPAGKTEGDLIARDTLTYHVEVENTGNVNLDNVTYDTSDFNPGTSLSFNMPSSPDSGDTGGDGILGVGETWIYDVEYDLWQQDILAGAVVNQIDVSADDPVNNPVTDASATLTTTLTQLPIDVVARPGVCGMVNYSNWEVAGLVADPQIIFDGTNTSFSASYPRDAYNALALSDDGSRAISRFGVPDISGSSTIGSLFTTTLSNTSAPNASHRSEYLLAVYRVEGTPGSAESFGIFQPSGSKRENSYYWIEDEAGIVLDTGGAWFKTWDGGDPNQLTTNFIYPSDGIAYVYIAVVDGNSTAEDFNIFNYGGCPNPAFTITKDVDAASISAPGALGYTITVENTGNVSLTTPALTDTLTQDGNALTLISGPTLDSGDSDSDGAIDPGETWVYSASYAATQANIDDGNDIINTASLDTDQLAPASDDATTTITTTPSLTIAKVDVTASAPTQAGDSVDWEITVDNTGNVSLTGVALTDTPTNGDSTALTLTSGPALRAATDTDSDGEIDPNETWIYDASYTLTQVDVDSGSVTNNVSVASTEVPGPTTAPNPPTTNITGTPAFTISKDVDTASISAPGTLGYTIAIENTGNVSLTTPALTDALTQDGNALTLTSGPTLSSGDSDSDGEVDPGESWVYSASYAATQANIDDGNDIINTASFNADEVTAASDDATTSITTNAALSLVKVQSANDDADGSGDISLGDTLTYRITATNDGNVSLSNVVVSDSKTTPSSQTCASVAPAAICVLTGIYTVTQADIDAGSISNTGSVTSTEVSGPITTPPVVTTTQTSNPSLTIAKVQSGNADEDSSGSITLGDTLTYTVTATNDGNVTLNNVIVSDPLTTPNSQTCASLAPGATCVLTGMYQVTLADADAGQVTNTAAVQSDEVTTPVTDGPIVTAVTSNHAFTITKDVDTASLSVPGALGYMITVENTGNASLTTPALTDALTQDGNALTLTSGPTLSSGDSDSDGEVDPGESWVYSASYAATQANIDEGNDIINTASFDADQVTAASDDAVTTITASSALTITKTDVSAAAPTQAGDSVDWEITVDNTGNVSLTGVSLTDIPTNGDSNALTLTSGPTLRAATDADSDGEIDPSETWVYDASYTLSQADIDSGSVSNAVSVTTNEVTGPTAAPSPPTTNITRTPALSLAKVQSANDDADGSGDISLGDTLTYTITATNDGNITLNNVVVSDNKTTPNSQTCVSVSPTATCVLTGSYTVSQADIDSGSISNSASVTSTEVPGPITTPPVVTTTQTASPSLALAKLLSGNADEDGSGDITLGDTLTYTITATNDGNVTQNNVVVSDQLTTPNSQTCATLVPAATCVLAGTYQVSLADADAGQVSNTASVQSDEVTTAVVTAPVVTPIAGTPALSLSKMMTNNADEDASGDVSLGDTLTYSIAAINGGNVSLSNVEISDDKTTPPNKVCATVAPAETCILTGDYTVAQADIDGGSISNSASVTSVEVPGPITTPPVVTTTQTGNPSLALGKVLASNADEDTSGDISVGDTLTYTITATNDGNITLNNVVVSDNKTTPNSQTCVTLAPAATCVLTGSYQVSQADIDGGLISNSASATSTETPNPVTTPPVVTVTQTGNPSLTLAKILAGNADEDASGDVSLGDTLTYTITATNDGNVTLNNVVVSDPKTTPTSQTCATLAPAATCVFSGTYQVSLADADTGSVSNTATVQSNEITTPITTAPVITVVTGTPALSLAKVMTNNADEDGSGDVSVGDTLTYEVAATNDGNVSLTNVLVSDNKTDPASKLCPSLVPAETCVLTGDYQVSQADIDSGSVSNSASVASDEITTPITTPPVVTATTPANPSLALTKLLASNADDDGTGTVSLGDTLTYIVTATNDGNITQHNVTVSDSKIAPASAACASLAPGETCALTGQYVVTVDDAGLTSITNIGSVVSDQIITPVEATHVTEVAPAGSINGLVFADTNNDGVFQTGEKPMVGWIVELGEDTSSSQSSTSASSSDSKPSAVSSSAVSKAAATNIIATTTTNAQGYYEFTNLPLGNYTVYYRNPANGVLYGSAADVNLTGGSVTLDQDFPIDPSGVFYDAVSRQPVAGVVASLMTANGTVLPTACFADPLQQNQLSGIDGFYRFDIVPGATSACPASETNYRISFDAPGIYSDQPSTVIAPQAGALNPAAGVGAITIAPQATAPVVGEDTTYYLSFILANGDRDVINNHIPLDPFQTRNPLVVGKTSIKRSASVGDLIPYTITVRNPENVQRAGVDIVDIIPSGFKYVPGSAQVNGAANEPVQVNRELLWADQVIPANDNVTYDVTMVVGAGVTSGDRVNIGLARNGLDNSEISNRGQAVVSIVPSTVFDCAEIIGKVFDDRNGNGHQDQGESGMAGIRLATVNGQLITTDSHGRYHITCAAVPDARIGSNFVLKLDRRTLPAGYVVTSENPRAVRMTRGKVTKLNFGVKQAGRIAIDLDARAFEGRNDTLTRASVKRLLMTLKAIDHERPVIRIRYALSGDESFSEVRVKLDKVSQYIASRFVKSGGKAPVIETDIYRKRTVNKGGDDQ